MKPAGSILVIMFMGSSFGNRFSQRAQVADLKPGGEKRTERPLDVLLSSKALDMARRPRPYGQEDGDANRSSYISAISPAPTGQAAYFGSGLSHPSDRMHDHPAGCKPSGCIVALSKLLTADAAAA